MLSSLGLGSIVSSLPLPIQAPGASGPSVQGGSGTQGSGPGSGTSSHSRPPVSAGSVEGTGNVDRVQPGAGSARAAYVERGSAVQDGDRSGAIATQRAIFRAELIDRMGQAPESSIAPEPGTVETGSGSKGSGGYAANMDTEMAYSY
ncbi:MAG: hypothetical protein ACU0DK_03865 [Pseudooceanicola sp.]